MTCTRIAVGALAVLALAAGAETASAAPIFATAATVNVAAAPAVPANPPSFGSAIIAVGNGNSLTFATLAAPNQDAGAPGTTVGVGQITFNPSTASSVAGPFDVNFNYLVTLTDTASAASGTFNFTGELKGTLHGGATPAILSSLSNLAVSSSALVLGGNIYSISVGPTAAPATNLPGVLDIIVVASPVPEPASAALLGLPLLFVRRSRR